MTRSIRAFGLAALALLHLVALLALAAPTGAADIDWDPYAEVRVAEVLSSNEDGSTRTTKVWLAVVDGQGYIRTGHTGWGANVTRNPDIVLRIEDAELPLRVHFVEDPALRERVVQTFREKHGFKDAMIALIRGSHPKIMRLDSR
ncbi:MAG: hypothetical protein JRG96_07100 [Deltaproteobacteria bacterium]|nr:hypothetical protein [Deltaproteobacteria bacterium]MBW2418089.1 hypothetical protein [Deltaproteobacteria bacterium]